MTLKEKAEAKAREYQVADVCQVWNGGCPNVRHASMEMFEWTKQQLVDKAAEWIINNSGMTLGFGSATAKDFRKAMEE